MICKSCGSEFLPDADVDRLMLLGQIAQVCDRCALATAPKTPTPLAVSPKIGGNELCRVEIYCPAGKLLRFIALPPKPKSMRPHTLRKPKKSDIHVFIMSENSRLGSSHPPIRLSSNIDTFEKQETDFWALKTPGFWDGFTGVAKIDVCYSEIANVDRQSDVIELHLHDGGKVLLRYR